MYTCTSSVLKKNFLKVFFYVRIFLYYFILGDFLLDSTRSMSIKKKKKN